MPRQTTRFLRFALVGGAGFVVDAGVLALALLLTGLGPYAGRALSFLAAATFTWWCNRRFTFRAGADAGRLGEWARFLAVNLVGGGVNLAVYAWLITAFEPLLRWPLPAVALGSLAGLGFNFVGSSLLVFGRRPPRAAARGP